jgi:site-specific DNA-methyltransferase (adenine-specific)
MIEINSVNKGDCLEVMAQIPDKSIDMIFADLPFYQEMQSFETNLKGKDKKIASYIEWNKKLVVEFDRVLKDGGNICLVNAPHYILQTIYLYLQKFVFRSQVPLIRRGSLRPAWLLGFQHNIMVMLCKGDKKIKWSGATKNHDKNFPTDVWTDITYQNGYRGKGKNNWHPEAINLEVVQRAIELNTLNGDVVLDCCAGSGTSGIACMNLGRNYILIEKEQKYIDIINKRIENYKQI